jgi:hypothetical protein
VLELPAGNRNPGDHGADAFRLVPGIGRIALNGPGGVGQGPHGDLFLTETPASLRSNGSQAGGTVPFFRSAELFIELVRELHKVHPTFRGGHVIGYDKI